MSPRTIAVIIIIVVIAAAAAAIYYLGAKPGATTTSPATTPKKTTPKTPTTTPTTTPATTTPPVTTTTTAPPTMTTTAPPTTTPKPPVTTKMSLSEFKAKLPPEAKLIVVSKAVIVVAPKSVKDKIPLVHEVDGKRVIMVFYEVDWKKTPPVEKCRGFSTINPAFYRNITIDALIIAARKETRPDVREALYEAVHKLSNEELPILWLGQYVRVRVQWNWVHGRYYHPVLAERWDLIWEDSGVPKVPTGIRNYVNDERTFVIITFGWPDTFDPAANYESFGWEIFHQIGDTLVTYWKSETKELVPDLAVAWAHDEKGLTWYFVIRGGVKAYDPWHNKVYDVKAIDVLFTIWRIARLGLDPSWMITEFIDVNASKVLTEKEFEEILAKGGIVAEYKGKVIRPKSLKELLDLFGYNGPTAGVVMLKLKQPYAAILSILADPFTTIIPMKYLFDYVDALKGKYEEALKESNYGKNPATWAKYIKPGENDPTHLFLHKYPIGTGPYYIAEYVEKSYIVLKYNPYYWNKTLWTMEPYGVNGEPKHKTIIYIINDDAVARIQMFKKGVGDIAAIPLARLKDVEGYTYPGTSWKIVVTKGQLTPVIVFIVLNTMKEPFNNKLVRQALMYAIPFEQIKKTVYAGYLERLYGVLPVGFPGCNNEIVTKYTFNIAKAKELIKKSGIDPSKYTIEIWYNQGNTQREKIASLLQQTWGLLGFKVTVRALPWPTLLDKAEKGDFQVYIIGWGPDYLDPDDYAGPLLYGATKFSYIEVVTP